MKLATYEHGGKTRVGVVQEQTVTTLTEKDGDHPIGTMLDIISRFDEISGRLPKFQSGSVSLSDVHLLAPIPRPLRNVLCIGRNYPAHAVELERSGFTRSTDRGQEAPIVFTKPPESVVGHLADVRLPPVTDCLDYEAELAVVIAKQGRAISRADAPRYIFGFTIVNDITARDLQLRHGQWFLGKALDTSCPMGPWVVTPDEIDVGELRISCWVNEDLRQDATTSDLIFDVPSLIATISEVMTLYPGDVIATGTPSGVGTSFDPPKFLVDGDMVHIEISDIGTLTNRIIAE